MKKSNDIKICEGDKIFSQKLTLYGQFLAIYLIILIIFIVLRAFLNNGEFTFVIYDPIVLLMLLITVITSIVLILLTIKKRQIIFGKDYLIFRNRFFAKKIYFSDIEKIKIGHSPTKVVNNSARIIRIKIKHNKKFYLVRTATFSDEKDILKLFIELKKQIGK